MTAPYVLRPGEPVEFTDGHGGRYRGVVGADGRSVVVQPIPDPKLCALCDHDRRQHDATGCASRDRHGLCVCLKFRRPERTP